MRLVDGETYRKKAQHCLLAADRARDPDVRLALQSLARSYATLADYLDRQHGAAHSVDDQDSQKDS
jgi:hypothetical protein